MARFSTGVLTAAGSTTLPIISLYGGATGGGRVREIGVTNTTAVAVALKVIRLSATGTQGAVLVETKHDPNSGPALCEDFTTHTVTAANTDLGYRTVLGAAIGSGVIWTFGDTGLVIDTGTTNGIGVMVENGTGQACQAYIVWDE